MIDGTATMPRELSDTMRRAINWAAAGDGKLHRHPGGVWGASGDKRDGHFPTSTILALIARGLATVTAERKGPHGRFPTEVTLTDEGRRHAP